MIKLLIFFLLIFYIPIHAQENVPSETGPKESAQIDSPVTSVDTPVAANSSIDPDEEEDFNPRKSHWLTTFGFEGLKYEVPAEFDGALKDVKSYQQELWGGRVGFGGEIYLGANINMSTRVEGFYAGTLFTKIETENSEIGSDDLEISRRKTGNIWGVEAIQTLGLVFDFKTKNPFMDDWAYLTIEPFVEAGVGKAWVYNKLSYEYVRSGATDVAEEYRVRVNDELTNTRFGGGFNFTSRSGYFLYIKAFVNNYLVDKRKVKTYARPNNGSGNTTSSIPDDVEIDPVTTYAIGGGYKF